MSSDEFVIFHLWGGFFVKISCLDKNGHHYVDLYKVLKKIFPKSLSVCDSRKRTDICATTFKEQRLKIHQTHGQTEGYMYP